MGRVSWSKSISWLLHFYNRNVFVLFMTPSGIQKSCNLFFYSTTETDDDCNNTYGWAINSYNYFYLHLRDNNPIFWKLD